VLLNHLSGGSY